MKKETCLCEATGGEEHNVECPFPLYTTGERDLVIRWVDEAMNKVIRMAALAHTKANPMHKVLMGGNFVECQTCGRHAHFTRVHPPYFLLLHGRGCRAQEYIRAAQF